MTATMVSPSNEVNILRHVVSDEVLEAAAEETALSYTIHTSADGMCCN
jgi:hypothetical protein